MESRVVCKLTRPEVRPVAMMVLAREVIVLFSLFRGGEFARGSN